MAVHLDVSLWSADLTRLGDEIRALEPFADSFHLDVGDGRFAPALLFFPDLVAALRPLTRKPFHIHLFVERPAEWVDPFADAGADLILIHAENAPEQKRRAEERMAARGCQFGVAFQLETPVEAVEADAVLLLGTRMGVKGQSLDAAACGRLRQARSLMPDAFLIADGAIRENTVTELRAAGADAIVPGSLLVGSPDRAATARWLRSL